jgi:hypothetical protein
MIWFLLADARSLSFQTRTGILLAKFSSGFILNRFEHEFNYIWVIITLFDWFGETSWDLLS